MTEQDKVVQIIQPYRALISDTPALISLLYDADMMPEQIVSIRGAISVAAVCEAYQAGFDAGRLGGAA